ncbi:MAG: hypothetical protein H0T46_26615 [Deltaproteobacteria bacterium]|nr:hypothetical protein [Deltaproteobacteria bacterium]
MNRLALILLVVLGTARAATADPVIGRVLTAPTAWLPEQGTLVGTAGVDRRGDGSVLLAYGLGLASIEFGTDTDVRGCTACDGDLKGDALWLGRAAFRLGARQDAWFPGMPAVVVGLRNTFAARGHKFGGARVTDAYLVGSRVLGPVRLHIGGSVTDGGFRQVSLGPTVRPLAGFEWTPVPYPKTSVLGDVMWIPKLELDHVKLEWVAGWGVRYQALKYGSIELAVRHRQDEGLQESTVLVRVNGVWNPRRDPPKNRIADR